MRVWKAVYCEEEHSDLVDKFLLELYERITREHPRAQFDVDAPGKNNWEQE